MVRTTHALALALAMLAAPLGGCAGGRTTTQSSAGGEVEPTRTSVVVDNRSFHDYDVYAIRSGVRVRIGQVTAGRRAELTIPTTVVQPATPIAIFASSIGGGAPAVSEQFSVSPGDQVSLLIPPR